MDPIPTAPASRTARPRWQVAAIGSLGFVALLWVLEIVDENTGTFLDAQFFANGVHPRTLDGLEGIAFAPLLHVSYTHLMGNTIPLAVLGFLLLLISGVARALAVTAVVWLVAGTGVWLTAPSNQIHLGASVLVFGWLTYLLLRGIFVRSLSQVLLGLVLLVVYGSVLWGVLPGAPGISWQGHLFGAVGGAGCAVAAGRRTRTPAA